MCNNYHKLIVPVVILVCILIIQFCMIKQENYEQRFKDE
jgi:hypothetical protein